MANKKIQFEVQVDGSTVRPGFAQVKDAAKDMAQGVATSAQSASKSIDGIGEGASASAQAVDRNTKSIIGSIQRATAQMEAGTRGSVAYYQALASQRGIGQDALKPYLDALESANRKQREGVTSLNDMGISAKQTAFALRGVPAQFTDIVTSLQGGQKPMTVLLQQGGQLKDMFGGAGNAARALGGYIVGLATPLNLALAALAGVGFAFHSGSQESKEFAKAIALSGNAAGVTSSQLQGMAANIAKTTGTSGAAAEALAALVTAGDVGYQGLAAAAEVAMKAQKYLGISVSDTVDAYAQLAKDPVAASKKLNDQYGYLTQSVLQQINALQEQGKTIEAVNLAQKAFGDSMGTTADVMRGQLGTVEKAWLDVRGAVVSTWDAIKGIGREDTATQQLSKAGAALEDAKARARYMNPSTANEFLADAQMQLSLAQSRVKEEKKLAEVAANRVRLAKDESTWMEVTQKDLTKREKLENEITRIRNLGLSTGKSELEIQKAINNAREKYKEPKGSTSTANPFADQQAAGKEWESFYKSFSDANDKARGKVEELTASQVKLIQFLQSPAYQKMPEGARQLALQSAYAAISSEKEAIAQKELAKVIKESANDRAHMVEAMQRENTSLDQHIQHMADENEAYALAAKNNITLAQAMTEVEVARLREQQTQMMADEQAVLMLEERIKKTRELAGVTQQNDAIKEQTRAQIDMWKSIDNTAHDVFASIFDGGQNAFKKLGQALKTYLIDVLYQMTVKKWLISIGASITGNAAFAQSGGSSGSFGGMNWLTDFGGSVAQTANSLGEYLVKNATGPINNFGSSLMQNANALGDFAQAAGNAAGYLNAFSAASKGKWGEAIGSAVGTYFGGPIGSVIGSTIGKWLDKAFGGETRGGGQYAFDPVTGTAKFVQGPSGGQIEGDLVAKSIAQVTGGINARLAALGSAASLTGFQAGLENSTKGRGGVFSGGTLSTGKTFGESGKGSNYDGTLYEKTSANSLDAKTALENFLTDLNQATIQALQAAGDLPKTIANMIAGVDAEQLTSEAAAKLVTDIDTIIANVSNFKTAIQSLPFEQLKNLSFDTAAALGQLSGGFDKLGANLGTYYDKFYSQSEKTAALTAQVSDAFKSLGLTMPTLDESARANFRTLVEGQDLTTESGRKTYTTLLGLAGVFDHIAPAVDAALQEIAARAKAVADERAGLQTQLDNLTLSSTDLLARQRNALDESNRALFDQVQAAQAAKNAQDELAQSAAALVAKFRDSLSSLGDTTFSLQNQLLSLQGNDAEVLRRTRARDLAQLTSGLSQEDAAKITAAYDYNAALQEQINALQAAKDAAISQANAQTSAADAASKAADQVASAWRGISDSLLAEVNKIRGQVSGNGVAGYAQAQTQFAIATGQARAGDQEAAKMLPALSQTLLTLAAANAQSLQELRRIQGQTAASLEATALGLGAGTVALSTVAGTTTPVPIVPAPSGYSLPNVGSSGSNADLVAELQAVRAELAAIKDSVSNSERYDKTTADTMVRVTRGGESMLTTAA